jgi:hypothetical protein
MKGFSVCCSVLVLSTVAGAAVAMAGGIVHSELSSATAKGKLAMGKIGARDVAQESPAPSLPLPRDPDIAVAEEFALARSRGTVEAWQLFIARHGDHQLAAKAQRELDRLKRRNRR